MTHCHGWVTEKTTDALPVWRDPQWYLVLPSLTVFFPASHSLGIPASMLCKVHLRQSGLGEGVLAGEEPAPSHCVTEENRSLPPVRPGILNPNHRTRASASHSTPPPTLLRCLQGKGGAVNPDRHPTVRVVAWNLSLCQIQSGRHSFHMSTQA